MLSSENMSSMMPPAVPMTSMALPEYSFGTSTVASSIGSSLLPSSSVLYTTRGRPTWNSKPSRRMVSIENGQMQHATAGDFACRTCPPVSSMRMEMLLSFSRMRRSLSWRAPTMSPSRPTSGLVEASNTTAMVGSSTAMGSMATGFSGSVMTSPMSACLDADHGHDVAGISLRSLPSCPGSRRCTPCGSCALYSSAVGLHDQHLLLLVQGAADADGQRRCGPRSCCGRRCRPAGPPDPRRPHRGAGISLRMVSSSGIMSMLPSSGSRRA